MTNFLASFVPHTLDLGYSRTFPCYWPYFPILEIPPFYSVVKYNPPPPKTPFPYFLLNNTLGIACLGDLLYFTQKIFFFPFALSLSILTAFGSDLPWKIWHSPVQDQKWRYIFTLFLQKNYFLTFLGMNRSSQCPLIPTDIVRIYKGFKTTK